MISLVTPTGYRPEAFELCKRWMLQQTLPFDEWIVVDDSGEVEITGDPRIKVFQNHIKAKNTQADSLLIGLSQVAGDIIFCIEDDDVYAPNYLERMAKTMQLRELDLLGEFPAIYYHIGEHKYRWLNNSSYACLCQTVMNRRAAKLLLGIVAAEIYPIDMVLWTAATKATNIKQMLLQNSYSVIGLKGMPGRNHGGVSWNPELGDWKQDDAELSKLQELIPRKEDFELYRKLIAKL